MKRGGLELYAGPVGRNSCELIQYFEVKFNEQNIHLILWQYDYTNF